METTILLSARRYDFKDEATGKTVQGVNLQYVTRERDDSDDQRGCLMFTISAPFEVWEQLKAIPGVYDMDFKQRPGKGGRPTLQCVSATYKGSFDALNAPTKPA